MLLCWWWTFSGQGVEALLGSEHDCAPIFPEHGKHQYCRVFINICVLLNFWWAGANIPNLKLIVISQLQCWRCLCGDTRPKHCANGKAAFHRDFSAISQICPILIQCRLTTGSNWSEVAESTLLKRPQMISATPISTGRLSKTKVIFWLDFTFYYFSWLSSSLQAPLLGNHISYTVDVSNVGCHCNSAFYFVQMPGYDAGQVFVIALSSWPASKFSPMSLAMMTMDFISFFPTGNLLGNCHHRIIIRTW